MLPEYFACLSAFNNQKSLWSTTSVSTYRLIVVTLFFSCSICLHLNQFGYLGFQGIYLQALQELIKYAVVNPWLYRHCYFVEITLRNKFFEKRKEPFEYWLV